MKKIFAPLLMLLPLTGLQAQWNYFMNHIYYNSGFVGIGTDRPTGGLDVRAGNGSLVTNSLYFYGSTYHTDNLPLARLVEYYGMRYESPSSKHVFSSQNTMLVGYRPVGQDWGNNNLFVSGNVGIGTQIARTRLDLGNDVMLDPSTQVPNKISLWNNGSVYYGFGISDGTLNSFSQYRHNYYTHPTAGQPRNLACFVESGGMGIGVSSLPAGYTGGGYQLAVNGRITAKEVKVTLSGLGDYVFSPAYRLRPLSEVEAFVKQNGHLPEVPSAAEVAKEGMNVGEMENTLLKKVEELTLYVIEQNKKLDVLQQENQQQARQIEHLQSRKKK